MRLDGRVAIVTGGARGIGRAYVRRLHDDGASVVVADLDEAAARATAEEEGASRAAGGAGIVGVGVDVSDEGSTVRMAEAAIDRFGSVDILVNNAALFADLAHRPFDEIPIAEWDRVMAVNVRGPWLCARAVLPHMKAQGRGRIINIGSGILLSAVPNLLHYVTSKGAVFAFTRALAREVGQWGITVNTLAPGLTITEGVRRSHSLVEIERGRASRAIQRDQIPDDLAGAMAFLASDDSAFVTGQMLVVNGGAQMW